MSTQGKIKTLFSDKEKTEALFPRTKVSAISDSGGTGLDAILDSMVHVGSVIADAETAPVNADTLGGRAAADFATQSFVTNKIAEAQLGGDGGEIDLSGYATKDDLANIDYPVDSVNGKTGAVQLNAGDVGARPENWMPTAEQVGARPNTWMPSATDVGAHPNTWLPTTEQIGAVPAEAFNAQTEAFLSHYVPFNASTICFSIKGKNLGFDARYPVTLHIASKMSYMGFIQFNMNATNGAPIEGAYMLYGNLPVVSFKYHTNGDTTTYLLQSYSWNFWGGVEVKTFEEFAVKGLNDTTLDSGTEMVRVKGVTPEQIGAAPAGYGLGGDSRQIEWSEIDNITANGNYCCVANTNICGMSVYYAHIRVDCYDVNAAVQTLTSSYDGRIFRRVKCYNESAQAWQWTAWSIVPYYNDVVSAGLVSRYATDCGFDTLAVTADNIDGITAQGIYYTEQEVWAQTIVLTTFWATIQIQVSWDGRMRSRIKWGGHWSAWNIYATA